MFVLIVPGTTISVRLLANYVEVRDKGIVKKKIRIKGKSFDEVHDELEAYFRYRGKILAPGIIKDTLTRIGVPYVKRIISEDALDDEKVDESPTPSSEEETQPEVTVEEKVVDEIPETVSEVVKAHEEEPKEEEVTLTESEPVIEKPPEEPSRLEPTAKHQETKIEFKVSENVQSQTAAARFVRTEEKEEASGDTITGEDFEDITDALRAVESLSDSFMAASPSEEVPVPERKKREVKISLEGHDEIIASSSTQATAPERVPEKEPEEVATEEEPEETPAPEIDEHAEPVEKESVTETEEAAVIVPDAIEDPSAKSSATVIKPIVEAKALILGEDGVGKASLIRTAGLDAVALRAEKGGLQPDPYIHEKIYEGENHRVKVRIWSFDEAVKAKVSRKDYYDSPSVIIIVYAVSDRWSFESIDFWLKECKVTNDVMPPVLIVGNKVDLRKESASDFEESPVEYDEGFELAEKLAKELSMGKLHRVAFVETSCLTGEGVDDVFKTAATLFESEL